MLAVIISLLLVIGYLFSLAYRVSPWHPLSHIPGPWRTAISSLWLQYHTFHGTQGKATRRLHHIYGPIVRVGPNEVEIADGAALWPIYIKNGGFDKSHHYAMLDIDGHSTVFSTLQNRKRADRLKVALPFFSAASAQRQVPMLKAYAVKLAERLERDKIRGDTVDLLDRCRSYSLDTTSSYVFGEAFGAMEEDKMSIAPVVDNFVEVNLLFNIPSRFYRIFSFCYNAFVVKTAVKQADAKVDKWIRDVVVRNLGKSPEAQKTYPGRLAALGMPLNAVVPEGKDAIFGATDALGLALSLILWRLASNTAVYAALREELESNAGMQDEKLQSLPILTGIIKEVMRLSSTVPCKLPRVTPREGMIYKDIYIPGNVVVGVAPCILHFNEQVYPEPYTFRYQRWQDATEEMSRDWMPFGKGARACLGRHLAMLQLCVAVSTVVRSGVLNNARTMKSSIEFWEWYNVKVAGGTIEIGWQESPEVTDDV
ncbi:uncharacterized protein MYCFIDRAFT_64230 [Pseudocercospora fijiensis CIRAD86]|uniref:Cytochrome P450 n=1 Tax=Pseudocercospora fijiensis (strain CIRAD86) TaxID=383855 RepID=M3B0J2_PSEFD|nr:uncharacterized protein MYCFIDRAFT_64230 [Pseudocercospora fijiensis CIRAD86]EME82933.1 hypothetical protein MYCFIDRAFT_64230 [Pseudocercospora fijiensis CIRAD86]